MKVRMHLWIFGGRVRYRKITIWMAISMWEIDYLISYKSWFLSQAACQSVTSQTRTSSIQRELWRWASKKIWWRSLSTAKCSTYPASRVLSHKENWVSLQRIAMLMSHRKVCIMMKNNIFVQRPRFRWGTWMHRRIRTANRYQVRVVWTTSKIQ